MAKESGNKELTTAESAVAARSSLLSGVKGDKPNDKNDVPTHVGVAVNLRSSAGYSSIMIPDATKVSEGEPVYLSKPVELDLDKLNEFLSKKDVKIPTKPVNLQELMKNTQIVCGALYYSADKKKATGEIEKPGAMLLSFAIQNDKGILGSLFGEDEPIGKLLDVVGVAVRIVKCPQERLPELQAYVKELSPAPETSQVASEAAPPKA